MFSRQGKSLVWSEGCSAGCSDLCRLVCDFKNCTSCLQITVKLFIYCCMIHFGTGRTRSAVAYLDHYMTICCWGSQDRESILFCLLISILYYLFMYCKIRPAPMPTFDIKRLAVNAKYCEEWFTKLLYGYKFFNVTCAIVIGVLMAGTL